MHEAKVRDTTEVEIWGTGRPRREFLYSEDAADACVFLMNLSDERLKPLITGEEMRPLVNIGCGQDLTVRDVAELIAEVVGFRGRLVFDMAKPDGTPRKLLDTGRLTALGWKPKTSLREGLEKTYLEFSKTLARFPEAAQAPAARD
jgi:GDP-L-fucose synthase